MNVFNNFDFANKIKISPESFNNFVAGRILTPNKNNDIKHNNVITNNMFLISGIVIIVLILIILIILIKKF